MMGYGISVLLLTSAAGYWVLTASGKERGRVKTLGQWLGLFIIVLSVLGAACALYCVTTGSACPMMGGKSACFPMYGGMGRGSGACPFTGRGMDSSKPAQ